LGYESVALEPKLFCATHCVVVCSSSDSSGRTLEWIARHENVHPTDQLGRFKQRFGEFGFHDVLAAVCIRVIVDRLVVAAFRGPLAVLRPLSQLVRLMYVAFVSSVVPPRDGILCFVAVNPARVGNRCRLCMRHSHISLQTALRQSGVILAKVMRAWTLHVSRNA
jgi:hypothetical protein